MAELRAIFMISFDATAKNSETMGRNSLSLELMADTDEYNTLDRQCSFI